MSEGKQSLRGICEENGLKHSTILLWAREREEFANQYARAREIGQAARFEALNEKASAPPERDERGRIDPGWVAWKRLEIDTEKWTLAKQEPKKYGDRIEQRITDPDGNPLSVLLGRIGGVGMPVVPDEKPESGDFGE